MFIDAGIWDSGLSHDQEELLFYKSYGQTEINHGLLAYYRFERIIQDIDDYCDYIFLSDEGGDDRMQCFEYLQSNFRTNGTIEMAYQADRMREAI